jgi:uncharacterized protein HemX
MNPELYKQALNEAKEILRQYGQFDEKTYSFKPELRVMDYATLERITQLHEEKLNFSVAKSRLESARKTLAPYSIKIKNYDKLIVAINTLINLHNQTINCINEALENHGDYN